MYKNVFNRLYKLKKSNLIYDVWSFNGLVYAKLNKNDERATIVRRVSDIALLITHQQMKEWSFNSENSGGINESSLDEVLKNIINENDKL